MINIKQHSGIFTLEVTQTLKTDIHSAWDFFSSPKNLAKITPEHMGFKITSPATEEMHVGQIITYTIHPFRFTSTSWVTEITHVINKNFFVDEQRFGPYSMWHHEHIFKTTNKGIEMTDRVSYKPPFGFFGIVLEPILIRPQLLKIFEYRFQKLEKLFNQ